MTLVLGQGFGLYGHLAALAEMGGEVTTLTRYKPTVMGRSDLVHLAERIRWIDDEADAIARADMTCLVRRPADNCALATRLVEQGEGGMLVIEKPVAPEWAEAEALERQMEAAGRRWAVPYLFLYCDWFDTLPHRLACGQSVSIDWQFSLSPRAGAWKADESAGGGALAFYFIHSLAVLQALAPDSAARFTRRRGSDEIEEILAEADTGTARISIRFVLGAAPVFTVDAGVDRVFEGDTPFGPVPAAGARDPRVDVLKRFYRAIDAGEAYDAAFHLGVTRRWAEFVRAAERGSA